MSADRRLAIMANGPATVISAVQAGPGDKESALDWSEAEAQVRDLFRQAERGDRAPLLEMFKLIGNDASRARDRPTSFFATPVLQAVRAGRLLIIPGWPRGPIPGMASQHRRNADDHRLIKHIMGEDQHLALERQKYRLIHAEQWQELRATNTHVVVPKEHATRILKRLAGRIASPPRRASLHEAAGQLAHTHKPGATQGLMLVRQIPKPGGSAALPPKAPAPATTPSAAKPPAAGPAPATARKVLTIAWSQAEVWCSEDAAYAGTTEGYAAGDALEVTLQEQGGGAHKQSLKLSSSSFSDKWSVKDVLPIKTGAHLAKELKVDAEAGGQKSPKPLLVRFAPTAKEITHKEDRHVFSVAALDYVATVKSEIKFVPGWGASVVKLGNKASNTTGGLLDGQLAWSGYRWMKTVGVTKKFWNGKAWEDLPKGFTLLDANNFCVGFYQSGTTFTCQYGGSWPEAFTAWNVDAPDKAKKIKTWTDNIVDTWTGKFDLKSHACKSGKKACCRYTIKVNVSFTKQSAFATGVIIVADGNIRSNDSLFFLDEPRVAMAAHEFGHHIGNPDEYAGAKLDTSLNSDGAKNGIDRDSIMGQNLSKVKARHFKLLAKVLSDALAAECGKTFTFDAVAP